MKYITLMFGVLFMSVLSAKGGEPFEIKIGNASLKGMIPGKRTSRAPDLAISQEFDICGWLEDEENQKHNAQKELLRKLWEFKRLFKAPHGSLVFTISIANNLDFNNDLKSYYEWIAEKKLEQLTEFIQRGYVDHNYTPAEGYEEFDMDGHRWMKYHANNNSSMYYRTYINDHIILRLNLIQSDDRKNAVKGEWHPEAEKLAEQIIDSIELTLPEGGKLCDNRKGS